MSPQIIKKPQLASERLVLKPFTQADRDRLKYLLTDNEITKTFMVPEFANDEEAYALVDKLIAFSSPEDTVHYEYGVYLDGLLIGFVNDCGIEETEIEIGYVIDPVYKGRGFATEAAKAAIEDLRSMGFRKVIAGYFEENPASRRVMEKAGMHPNGYSDEGMYRGKKHKCLYCEITFD